MSIEEVYRYPDYEVVCDFCGRIGPLGSGPGAKMEAARFAEGIGFTTGSYHNGVNVVTHWACTSGACQQTLEMLMRGVNRA